MSTGLRSEASAGNASRRRSPVASASSLMTSPSETHASVARMPGPPEFVTMPARGPAGNSYVAKTAAVAKRSSMPCTRSTPTCASSVSIATS